MQHSSSDAGLRGDGGYPPQRPASSPPQTTLSKAPVRSDGHKHHEPLEAKHKQSAAQHAQERQQPSAFSPQHQQRHDSSQPEQQQLQIWPQQQARPGQLQQEKLQQVQDQLHAGASLHEQAAANSRLRQSGGRAAVVAELLMEQSEPCCPLPEGLQTVSVQQHLQQQQQQQQQQQSNHTAREQTMPSTLPAPTSMPFSAAAGSATHSFPSDHKHAAAVWGPKQPAHAHGIQAASEGDHVGRSTMMQHHAGARGLWGPPQPCGSLGTQQAMALQHAPNQQAAPWQPYEQHHIAPAAAPVGAAAAADVDDEEEDALQVQQLSVTPHGPPRQLSGNPFAELPQQGGVIHHVTMHSQHAQQTFQSAKLAAGLSQHQAHSAVNSRCGQVHHSVRPGDAEQTAWGSHHRDQTASKHGQRAESRTAKHGQHAEQTTVKLGHHAEQTAAQHGRHAEQTPPAVQAFSQHRDTAQASLQLPAYTKSPAPAEAVDSSHGPPIMTHWQADALVPADQMDWMLLHDLEVEAVAADEEACLQELQVGTCLHCMPCNAECSLVHCTISVLGILFVPFVSPGTSAMA